MKLTDRQLDELLNSSSPSQVRDEVLVRNTVAETLAGYARPVGTKRVLAAGAIFGGLVLAGTTAAALPSIFDGFGRIDYQSSQLYTVDGRGPFRCEFGFRVDPPVNGVTLEPSADSSVVPFDHILAFVQHHDWAFDDEAVALTTPADQQGASNDVRVMREFISKSWKEEVEATYPTWMASVGGVSDSGQCLSAADGSAP